MNEAVGKKRGVRLTPRETKNIVNRLNVTVVVDSQEYEELEQKARCAEYYGGLKRCGLCGKIAIAGYICLHCGKDDMGKGEEL